MAQQISNITDPIYQSTFLPIFSRAETELKKLITDAYLFKTSRYVLLLKIDELIKQVDKKVDKNLTNRADYMRGLYKKSREWIVEYYDKPMKRFLLFSALVYTALYNQNQKIVKVDTPMQMINAINDNKIKKDIVSNMWKEAKGSVRVDNYADEIKRYINNFSNQSLTTQGEERSISLWQKAEIDIRHKHQVDHLHELINEGVELAYLSSHPDCSKRCEKWQGKLVSLTEHATMSGMRVRKSTNGEWIYSLTDIMAQKDKYGYNNNIISGFNCFDKETEVLTNNGWKLFADLRRSDLIYTLNTETRISEWQKPIRYFKTLHSGKMIHAFSNKGDLMITPNHNVLYFTKNNKKLRFKEAEFLNKNDIQLGYENNELKNQIIFTFNSIEQVDYNDYVYCVEVPNHTLLVKRNGYIQWCGNCRHHLIPYTEGTPKPKVYEDRDIKKEREINGNLRQMEREIRKVKAQAILYSKASPRITKKLNAQAKQMTAIYKQYAEKNGFAWYDYRLKV